MLRIDVKIIVLLLLEAMKELELLSVWKKVWKFCDFSIFFFKKWLSFMKGRSRFLITAVCRREVIRIELSPKQKQQVQMKFDSYCKKTIKGEVKHYWRELTRQKLYLIYIWYRVRFTIIRKFL